MSPNRTNEYAIPETMQRMPVVLGSGTAITLASIECECGSEAHAIGRKLS